MPAPQIAKSGKSTAFSSPINSMAEAQNISSAEEGAGIKFWFPFNGGMSDNDLHWNVPGSFEIDANGRWVLQSTHLSNMQKSGSAHFVGQVFKFEVSATYYDGPLDEAGQCTGNLVYFKKYVLVRLDYKEQVNDLSKSGVDFEFSRFAKVVRSGSFVRVID